MISELEDAHWPPEPQPVSGSGEGQRSEPGTPNVSRKAKPLQQQPAAPGDPQARAAGLSQACPAGPPAAHCHHGGHTRWLRLERHRQVHRRPLLHRDHGRPGALRGEGEGTTGPATEPSHPHVSVAVPVSRPRVAVSKGPGQPGRPEGDISLRAQDLYGAIWVLPPQRVRCSISNSTGMSSLPSVWQTRQEAPCQLCPLRGWP